MDRRNFLSAVLRGGAIVGLAATCGYLLLKKGSSTSGCDSICNGCKSLPICTKPEAIQVKKENPPKVK